jgi:multidrug efflux system outer membrane protein
MACRLASVPVLTVSGGEVGDVLIQIVKGKEELAAQQRQVDALEEYARLARLQFEAGTSSYLSVLDADRTLFANKLSQAQLRFSLLVADITAYKVMGGGWIVEADSLGAVKK